MIRRRHLLTAGPVPANWVLAAAAAWRADEVNGAVDGQDAVLVIFDPDHAEPARFMQLIGEAGRQGAIIGALPVYGEDLSGEGLRQRLGGAPISIDFAGSCFRVGGVPVAQSPGVPRVLGRAHAESAEAVATDVDGSDLLFLQGHAGPADGSFGRNFTLCSRPIHRAGRSVWFPCAETRRCFRQPGQGRAESSLEGLVDPRTVSAKIVVLDGCGTFPVPGSLYRYEQSLLRGLMSSPAQALILSLGVSATPLSAVVLWLAMLARGRPMGEAVREANRHREGMGSPSSLPGTAAAPWVLVGDPLAEVVGLRLLRSRTRQRENDTELWFDGALISSESGALLAAPNVHLNEGVYEIWSDTGRWAHGARHDDGFTYLWVGARPEDADRPGRILLKPLPAAMAWRPVHQWLRGATAWLEGLVGAVRQRGFDAEPLIELMKLRAEMATLVETAASTAVTDRQSEIVCEVTPAVAALQAGLEQLDLATARTVAAATPLGGARLSHLWSPSWRHGGNRTLANRCNCGCDLVAHLRVHPTLDMVRAEISCPTCSLVGDVAAPSSGSSSSADTLALDLVAGVADRTPRAGGGLEWWIRPSFGATERGFACASLFDPFRERRVSSPGLAVEAGGDSQISLHVPPDWPPGLSWTTLVYASAGRLSMYAFDLNIREREAPTSSQLTISADDSAH
ncbi:MAG: hypothetical protein P4L64_15915 [Caulobacteraceae bacterium]|nr:hypothetical protein [Caulobacteraceae bacterium]